MEKRNLKYKLILIVCLLVTAISFESCESYLDKAPEATISERDVYGNFISFQGFIEELYACVVDLGKTGGETTQFNWGDESVASSGPSSWDIGNYWSQSYVYGTSVNTDASAGGLQASSIWGNGWYGIKKANLGLSKLDMMVDATQEEKDLIEGQALFFRGFLHFEIIKWYGGMPYMDRYISPSEVLREPRLNYRESSLKAADDLRAAADLLPVDWDQTEAGKATLGNNRQRASKVMALSMLGKVLLYAGSPMMNEESTGSATYDADLCKQAAAAFAEAISVCNSSNMFRLQPWATWEENFWVDAPGNDKMNGGTEAIMLPVVRAKDKVRWSAVQRFVPATLGVPYNMLDVPTHNWVKNYYMANGLPITDAASGYDPANPWVGREPRFYKDIVIDGDEIVLSSGAGVDKYAQLYSGGRHRQASGGSQTGYLMKRWAPIGCNVWDARWDNFQFYVPNMRLADVYLMYAEAVVNGYGTPQSSVPGSITAIQAINIIRNRVQLPDLTAAYTASKEAFMADLIQERAVELAWDGNRLPDLRRWNLSEDMRYRVKTAVDFDRNIDGKPINITERVIITRVVEKKHNWLPLQVSHTKLYPEYFQNPGW